MISAEIDLAEITEETLEEITELDPSIAWATPLDKEIGMLPEQPATAGGRILWRWMDIPAKMTITHIAIRYAQRRLVFILGKPCHLRRGDNLEIIAALHQLQ